MPASSSPSPRRTQAERRAETYQQLLASACELFGKRGYANTSLEDIANDCGLTTRPIYHYFGNKKALFDAVNETMEKRILESISAKGSDVDIMANWHAFTELCDDPGFRQIVLIDSPNVLGKQRWINSAVTLKAQAHLKTQSRSKTEYYRQQLFSRMLMAAFAEAALVIAEAEDIKIAKQQAKLLIAKYLA